MGKVLQNRRAEEIDDHDQPTEPMPRFVIPSYPLAGVNGYYTPEQTIPVSQSYAQPGGQYAPGFVPAPYQGQYMPGFAPVASVQPGAYPPQAGNYPYLPQNPAYPAQPASSEKVQRKQRYSPIPALVGMGFVLLQLLLLTRIAVRLVNLSAALPWVSVLYALTTVFVMPFQALLQQFSLTFPANVEVYTLLAVLAYGLLSRLLVRSLRLCLHTR